jgi:hypothetical protein
MSTFCPHGLQQKMPDGYITIWPIILRHRPPLVVVDREPDTCEALFFFFSSDIFSDDHDPFKTSSTI